MDYLGSLQKVSKGAQGYASYFVSSVLEEHFRADMTLAEGRACIDDCIKELRTRFIISHPSFIMKIITKDGVKVETL